MKNPASHSKMSDGYGAWSCEFDYEGIPGYLLPFCYVDIQVHPTDVRIDVYVGGIKRHTHTYPLGTVRDLCVALCNDSDCTGQLADAIEESYNDRDSASMALYLRLCGKLIDEYQADKKRREKAKLNRMRAEEAMKSLGLKKVRGAMGGTYWE